MTTINLKDFYAWYTHDEYIEVSAEVAAELKADKLYEAAHQRRTTRKKASDEPQEELNSPAFDNFEGVDFDS